MKEMKWLLLTFVFLAFMGCNDTPLPHPTKYAKIDCWGITTLAGQPEVKKKLLTMSFGIQDGQPFPSIEFLSALNRTTFDDFQLACNKLRYANTTIPSGNVPFATYNVNPWPTPDPPHGYTLTWYSDRTYNYATLSLSRFSPGTCSVDSGPCESNSDCCNHVCRTEFKTCEAY